MTLTVAKSMTGIKRVSFIFYSLSLVLVKFSGIIYVFVLKLLYLENRTLDLIRTLLNSRVRF